jgi:N-carbamoyl-L-amino-acid hydrolase
MSHARSTLARPDTERVIADLRSLAAHGRCDTGVDRRALSDADCEARRWLAERMTDAGLTVTIDAVGNVIGRTPHARRIVVGSHTDTVPRGGWLDGALGVIAGLEVAREVAAHPGDYATGIEVVSFSDEEGHFLPMLGSKSFCGELEDSVRASLRNTDGRLLAECLNALPESTQHPARIDPAVHVAFLELHIEQGPVLEAEGLDIGIVTHVVGAQQDRVEFRGRRNHAGTTPMGLRSDAAQALFRCAIGWSDACTEMRIPGAVWNVAEVATLPSAANVVPDRGTASFQYRAREGESLNRIAHALRVNAANAAMLTRTTVSIDRVFALEPTPMNETLVAELEDNARSLGLRSRRMSSGAGHDAMVLGRHIPAAMLFVPSRGGISHSTDEDTSLEQLARGVEVFAKATWALCNRA